MAVAQKWIMLQFVARKVLGNWWRWWRWWWWWWWWRWWWWWWWRRQTIGFLSTTCLEKLHVVVLKGLREGHNLRPRDRCEKLRGTIQSVDELSLLGGKHRVYSTSWISLSPLTNQLKLLKMFINWGCLIILFICDIDPELDTNRFQKTRPAGKVPRVASSSLLRMASCLWKNMREIRWELANKNVDLINSSMTNQKMCIPKSWLLGGWPTPLKNMSSSLGIICSQYMESHKSHVPNHQPDHHHIPIVVGL